MRTTLLKSFWSTERLIRSIVPRLMRMATSKSLSQRNCLGIVNGRLKSRSFIDLCLALQFLTNFSALSPQIGLLLAEKRPRRTLAR